MCEAWRCFSGAIFVGVCGVSGCVLCNSMYAHCAFGSRIHPFTESLLRMHWDHCKMEGNEKQREKREKKSAFLQCSQCIPPFPLRSHECNPLCHRLRLTPFIRCPADVHAVEELSTGSASQGKTVSRAFRKSSMIRRTVELNRAASVENPPGTFDAKEHRRRVEGIPLSVPDLYARCVEHTHTHSIPPHPNTKLLGSRLKS